MRANAPVLSAAQATVARVDVGQLTLGPATVGRLVVRDVDVGMAMGRAEVRDLRITITLRLSLEWRVSVDLLFDDFTRSGTWDLKDPTFSIGFGTVVLPGLDRLDIDVGELTATGLTASTGPIAGLGLGPLLAEQLRASTATLPASGFTLAGLGLASARADGLTVPDASVAEAAIGRLSGGALPLGAITIPDVAFPAAGAAEVRSRDVDVGAVAPTHVISAGGGLLRISLRIVPEARTQIAELVLTDISASATIGAVEVTDVVLPFEVLDLRLADLGITQIEIPTFEVS